MPRYAGSRITKYYAPCQAFAQLDGLQAIPSIERNPFH